MASITSKSLGLISGHTRRILVGTSLQDLIQLGRRTLVCNNTIADPSFGLTSVEKELQSTALNFALNEFRPFMRQWDEEQFFPREQLRKCGQLGFGGLFTPAEDGGAGLSRVASSVIVEALAQGCVSTTALLCIHNMCSAMLARFGSDHLKAKHMPGLVCFDKVASYCLTEPGSGSDAASLLTTAVKKDGYYILNGTKAFISGGGESDVYFVMARTGGPGSKGISCILVENGTKGLLFGGKEHKLGWNSQPTRAVILEDCKVPVENLVGQENRGFSQIMEYMNGGRLNIASCSLGAAQWALEEAIKYSSERKQFGKTLSEFQNTQFKISSFAAELLTARLIIRAAARRIDEEEGNVEQQDEPIDNSHIPISSLTSAAKLIATEKSFDIVNGCLQIFGGYGYLKDFPIQQLFRDSRIHTILGGTSEIMQLIIARDFR